MAAKEARQSIVLACTECKQRNYNKKKNKHPRPYRADEVLPLLQEAYHASRNPINARM